MTTLDEFSIIEKYFAGAAADGGVARGIGDDAALLNVDADCELAVTTDSLVAGAHFFPDANPFDIGYKALAVSLSDLAAMGAGPRWFTLALTLSPPQLRHDWLAEFSRGLAAPAHEYGMALVGGDLCRGPLAVTVQALGECPRGAAVGRDGARTGDSIYVSGNLGSAACALALLQSGAKTPAAPLVQRLLRPTPQVALGVALRGVAGAMIDVSDGLLADLGHVLRSSGVGARIDVGAVPHDESLDAAGDDAEKRRWMLAGGDDYELCFTVPRERQAQLESLGRPVYRIGEVTSERELRCLEGGRPAELPDEAGYRHF